MKDDNRQQIEERVIGVITSFIGDKSILINGQTDLAKIYDLDTLESARLIFGLEDKFGISFPNEDADKLFKTEKNKGIDYICSAPVKGFVDYVSE
ncbi:MAG: acyl carrier protein, partial [Nanoarchaeota archaeon]